MGADLRTEAVLERGDDPAAVRVVLRVGRGEEDEVEREADLVAPHLDVALLEHVQQADLDPLREVGQLVDGEDPSVGARHEPVVQGELVGEVPPLGHLDRVDLTDEVGDRGVGGGELLAVALAAVHPLDRRVVAVLRDQLPAVPRHGRVGVVVDLGAREDRHPLVEQAGERSDHAGLRLPALAEEDHVVAGEQRVLELRQDGVLEALHHREERLARLDAARWRCAGAPPSRAPRPIPIRGADRRWPGRDVTRSSRCTRDDASDGAPATERPKAACVAGERQTGHGRQPIAGPAASSPRRPLPWRLHGADRDLARRGGRRRPAPHLAGGRLRRRRLGVGRGSRSLAIDAGLR